MKIIHSEDVFDGKIPKKGVKVVARVSIDMPYLTKYNLKTNNQTYCDSLDSLPNNLKNKIVKEFKKIKKKWRTIAHLLGNFSASFHFSLELY